MRSAWALASMGATVIPLMEDSNCREGSYFMSSSVPFDSRFRRRMRIATVKRIAISAAPTPTPTPIPIVAPWLSPPLSLAVAAEALEAAPASAVCAGVGEDIVANRVGRWVSIMIVFGAFDAASLLKVMVGKAIPVELV
jgi:hypothetical protein